MVKSSGVVDDVVAGTKVNAVTMQIENAIPNKDLLSINVNPALDIAEDSQAFGIKSINLDNSADTVVSSSSQNAVGNATTMQVEGVVANIKSGKISGDPGVVSKKFQQALDSTNPQQLSTQAELRVAKLLKQEGNDVFVIDDLLRAPKKGSGFTNDLTVNGNVQVDVKRLGGLGRNAAGDLAKGVRQVGSGGQVIVVRGSESKASLSQIQDFVNNFKPKQPVTFRVIDEVNLPKLKGM